MKHKIDSTNTLSDSADTVPDASNQVKSDCNRRIVTEKGCALERVIEIKECEDRHLWEDRHL